MYIRSLLIILVILTLSWRQAGAQTANVTEGCFPVTVEFTAPAGAPGSFWDFGDGATSLLDAPSHTYVSAGLFTVEYSDNAGGPVVGTLTITIYEPPTPTFSADVYSGCSPLSVQFENTTDLPAGVTATGYSWVFGDGATATGLNTGHTFTMPGSYSVSVGVTTNFPSCNVTTLYEDQILASTPPQVSFSTIPANTTFCEGPVDVNFNNSSENGLDFQWVFGNGETSTAENPPAQTYSDEGTYTVTLIGTNDANCAESDQTLISIGQPVASFAIPDTICLGNLLSVSNLSPPGSFTWDFGPDASPQFSSLYEPSVLYTEPGFHDITLTINGDCPDDTTMVIYVEEVSAEFTSEPSYSCESPVSITFDPLATGMEYEWTFYDGTTSTDPNPTYVHGVNDTTIYSINGQNIFFTTLLVTSPTGCTATFFTTDTIHEPNALSFPDIVDGCVPLTVTFRDSSSSLEEIVEWEYVFGDGNSIVVNTNDNVTHTYTSTGEFEFYSVITNAAGCRDTSYIHPIEVGEQLDPAFTVSPTVACPGEEIQFTDNTPAAQAALIDAWHYSAEDDLMFHCFQEADPTWTFEHVAGLQDITLTVEYNGCYSSFTQPDAIDIQGPIAKMNFSCECDAPFDVQFTDLSQDATAVLWSFGDGATSTQSNPLHTYAATGDYTVVLEAMNSLTGCVESYDTMTVHIRDIQAAISVPAEICHRVPTGLDAGLSQDVDAGCYKGYTYSFSDPTMRPITVADPIVDPAFFNTGEVTVYLEVTDINGCTAMDSTSSIVYGMEVDYLIEPQVPNEEICFPSTVDFTDMSVGDTTLVSWEWDFGDGEDGLGTVLEHTYLAEDSVTGNPDFISVVLVVTDIIGCSESLIQQIDFYTPTSTVTVSDMSLCNGDSVQFQATDFTSMGSNLDFAWDFANGTMSSLQNPTVAFNEAGIYEVQLIFTEQISACTDSTVVEIEVVDYPIAGFFSAADTLTYVCPDENVTFNDTSIFSGGGLPIYSWDFGNGSTSNFENPGTFFASNGIYTVELIVELPAPFGCADTTSQQYNVYGPEGSFSTDIGDDPICRSEAVLFTVDPASVVDTFYWDFGDGIIGPGESPVSHVYDFVPPSGQTFAAMIMSNEDGSCPTTHQEPINIYEVVADFERNLNDLDTAICFQPYPISNVSLNSTDYYWDFGDGSTSSVEEPGVHNYASPGTYSVTLGVFNETWGCTDTLVKEIVLHPLPELETMGDTICEGETGDLIVLDPHPIWNYNWTTGSTYPVLNPNSPLAQSAPAFSSFYNVLVTDTNLCTSAEDVFMLVINPPDVTDLETIVPQGDFVELTVSIDTSLYFYEWTPDDISANCLLCDPPTVQAIEYQEYHVLITDRFNCFEAEGNFYIDVYPETFVTLPTTFTPNGDGINDVIYVEGWGVKELIEYRIFNRWGEEIFMTDNMHVGWDGTFKGVLQNNDVYVYKVTARNWKDELRSVEGHINLMR